MARKAGRQHDTNTLRTNSHVLYPFNPSIVSVAKSELGYVNEQTGRLLTPDDLDWDNATVSDLLSYCAEYSIP